jgi:hypothetical protein
LDLLTPDFSGCFSGSKFRMNECVSVTPPVILLRGWGPLFNSVCLRDSASDHAGGSTLLIDSVCPCDSASDPARGLDAAPPTRRVSATLPVTLLGGWAPLIHSACLRDSASGPAEGLDAAN